MARESKFKKGDQVKFLIPIAEFYEVVEVLRNELKLKIIGKDKIFTCKKSLLEKLN